MFAKETSRIGTVESLQKIENTASSGRVVCSKRGMRAGMKRDLVSSLVKDTFLYDNVYLMYKSCWWPPVELGLRCLVGFPAPTDQQLTL